MHVVAALICPSLLGFWTGAEGHAVLKRTHALLRGFAQGTLLSCANTPALVEALERAGFSGAQLLPGSGQDTGAPLTWLDHAQALAQDQGLSGPLLLLSLDNPLLDPKVLVQGRQLLDATDAGTVLSVIHAQDHPCQMFMAYKVLDMGLLHRFDAGRQSPGRHVTRPFAFPWAEQAFTGAPQGEAFAQRARGLGVCLEPVTANLGDEEVLYLREGPDEARLALLSGPTEEGMPGLQMTGRSFREAGVPPRVTLWQRPGEETECIKISLDSGWTGRLSLRLTPLERGGASGPSQDFDLGPSSGGPPATLERPAICADAHLYSILAIAENDGCDFAEYFEPVEGLWAHDCDSQRIINCATGEEVTGRQGFPTVVVPDGSIVLTHATDVLHRTATTRADNTRGLLLEDAAALRIRSPLDVFRWRIRTAAAPRVEQEPSQ